MRTIEEIEIFTTTIEITNTDETYLESMTMQVMDKLLEKKSIIIYSCCSKALSRIITRIRMEIKKRNQVTKDKDQRLLLADPKNRDALDSCLYVTATELIIDTYKNVAMGRNPAFIGYIDTPSCSRDKDFIDFCRDYYLKFKNLKGEQNGEQMTPNEWLFCTDIDEIIDDSGNISYAPKKLEKKSL